MQPIYLDHCSTTPLDPKVLDAMLPFLRELYGNPGTPHHVVGGVVQQAIRDARESVANLINCGPNELIWTSGATEANNLAILGFASEVPAEKRHLITQATEHAAVLEPCRYLEANGWRITYLSVDEFGRVSVDQLQEAIVDATSMVSIMWGNNEIGTLQPVDKIATLCASRDIVFHCDAVQAAGKVSVDIQKVGASMLTLSAHKFYGPKGVGALFVRNLNKRSLIAPRVFGGGQEKGLRAGTLNVPAIIGMGAACSLAAEQMDTWSRHIRRLRNRFESLLFNGLTAISLNGSQNGRLPHVSNIAFWGTENEGLLTMLPNLVASTGSACHVADFAPSHVLEALPQKERKSNCSLRFGFGKCNTLSEVDTASQMIMAAVNDYRKNA